MNAPSLEGGVTTQSTSSTAPMKAASPVRTATPDPGSSSVSSRFAADRRSSHAPDAVRPPPPSWGGPHVEQGFDASDYERPARDPMTPERSVTEREYDGLRRGGVVLTPNVIRSKGGA